MKILVVSIPSIHTLRWLEQLKGCGHTIVIFDILNRDYGDDFSDYRIIKNWKKAKFSKLFKAFEENKIGKIIFNKTSESFKKSFRRVLREERPDVVHSFNININYDLIPVMESQKNLPWIGSTWGSDLFYYKDKEITKPKVISFIRRLDYLFTDNKRDFLIAKSLGFKGTFLGVFPGGGGFDIPHEIINVNERKIILVKGYSKRFGQAITCLKAIELAVKFTKQYKIIVFSAHEDVANYAEGMKNIFNISIYKQLEKLSHNEMLHLMSKSLIYLASSTSDGMPNTMLEAIVHGAFPIQSNPGNVSAEMIKHRKNGLLINNPKSSIEISELLTLALTDKNMLEKAQLFNQREISPLIERNLITEQVVKKYTQVSAAL